MASFFPSRKSAGEPRRSDRLAASHRRRRSRRKLAASVRPLVESLEYRAMLAFTVLETSAAWKASAAEPTGEWTTAAFDDSAFAQLATGIAWEALADGTDEDEGSASSKKRSS